MAFSQIQGASAPSGGSTSTTITVTLTTNPVTGNLVCVGLALGGAVTSLTIKDANNNSYTISPNSPAIEAGSNRVYLAYLLSAPANASKTITAAWTTGQFSD